MSRLIIKNNKMTVRLHNDEADSFMAKAIAKSEKFERIASAAKSPYGFNHPHAHFVGMVAEHASWILFNSIEELTGNDLKIDPAYRDENREAECDLYVNGLRIEVKGIKYGSWLNFGPCISSRQLKKIEKKADIVLWALYNERRQEFSFEGFNYVKDIRSIPTVVTGAVGRPQIENHPVLDIIKPLQELAL
ncbi:hypothetical protein SEPL_492 [Salmonella phage SE_PL]|nr:hypothetical protein [Salmonella enterica]ELL7856326.1 hypothetical protein [Salmonella enterica]QCW18580.1 hypothetical protein 7t3_059 [Salmonella phage 7t3]QIG63105.1 hypothetical protein SEPL_492 [Salmonella phage SE_PL]